MSLTAFELDLLKEKYGGDELTCAVRRVENGEPLQYVLGEWYFRRGVFEVGPDCLIPRQETELVAEKAMELLPPDGRLADLCTGSGCIAVSVLQERPDCTALAVDISEKALEIAERNAIKNGVQDRVRYEKGDVLLPGCLGYEKFDVISANPPYVRSGVIDSLPVQVRAEPRLALDGGPDGLLFYRKIISNYTKNVADGGYLVFEIGYDQREALEGFGFTVYDDYSGNPRIAVKHVR
ncbi:MAG: peptide chain release factor N(5)-glutamine methyltransferase [Clostridia bacterium]|nr:peptide chain release factor N(5)-glutamine methyltransferase [Clostridia bacterium]